MKRRGRRQSTRAAAASIVLAPEKRQPVSHLEIRVEGVDSLAPGEAKTFKFSRPDGEQEGFVLNHRGTLYAYLNRCPHWGVDLDMGEGTFYSHIVDHIFCRNHGALFDPTTGHCVSGPCPGQALKQFKVQRNGPTALITIPI